VNRLAGETSPYLRQHADNPVDWYPWGTEALELARRADKPLFVSIGYASCHWCHVMAHESFEDPAVAKELNRSFVSVKVDREERPDIDSVYMAAVQAMTGQGGWPMSVFCTPDGRPFFAGTYFPPGDRHGMPGFRRVVEAMDEAWAARRSDVEAQADEVSKAVTQELRLVDRLSPAPAPDSGGGEGGGPGLLDRVVDDLADRFDDQWGGFGPAPKFPRPTFVDLALRHHLTTGGDHSRTLATRTLDAMAAGGIYDHVAGGFARYSTDRQWLVPHFEKMLTDQVLLARAYLHAWLVTGSDDYLLVASETLDFTLGDLGAPGGGLCSSLDADAGGREGAHATWTPDQARAALAEAGHADLYDAVADWYGITPEGNWEGVTILRRPLGAPLGRPAEVEQGRRALALARARRPQPSLDDKVLTEWNAMAASVLAEAAAVTQRRDWGRRAAEIVEFLFSELRRDGRWLRSWQDGEARHLALAGDYAWLVDSCTRLGELEGGASWLERASGVADELLDLFWDPGEHGTGAGLFVTGNDAEALIVRPKDLLDGAIPSAHATAAGALLRLSSLTGDERHREAAVRLVALGEPLLARQPTAVADLVGPALMASHPSEVVVSGDRPELLSLVRGRWLPDTVVAWGEPTDSPLWDGRELERAYVCRGSTCLVPAADAATLSHQLDELVSERPG